MEYFLVGLLVFLILLIVLALPVPAYLERLSRRHQAARDEATARSLEIEKEDRRYERLLTPYLRARSAAYRELASHSRRQIRDLKERIIVIDEHIAGLRVPQVFGYLLPVQHFFQSPEHVTAIWGDRQRLKRIEAELAEAGRVLARIEAAFAEFDHVPQRLAEKKAELDRRLRELETVIGREQVEGIEALDDFARNRAAINQFMAEWETVAGTGDPALTDLDRGAIALESAADVIADAEARAADLTRERMALDQRLRRATNELDNLQAAHKSGPGEGVLPQARPFLRRAAALLNESAPAHRRRREFNAAGADLSTATQLLAIARDLIRANDVLNTLSERDNGGELSEAIGRLRREFDDFLARAGSERADVAGGLSDAALSSQAGKFRLRGETLARQQDALIARLAQQATETRDALTRSWEKGYAVLPLADDEPLARRYARLSAQFDEAQQNPTALEAFNRDAQAFALVWEQWLARVSANRERVTALRAKLPDLIDNALHLAEPWNCLTEDVTFIQQRAADFGRIHNRFEAVHHRREAERLMEQLEEIEADIDARFALIQERAKRLRFLETEVTDLIKLATDNGGEPSLDHPDRAVWDRATRLIDHHRQSARVAHQYDDASLSLHRAAEAANRLAL